MLGVAKCLELTNQFSQAFDCVKRILISNQNLVCIVVEKIKLQLISQDWDLCNEVILSALSLDNECLEAFRYQILKLLCRDGRYNDVKLYCLLSFSTKIYNLLIKILRPLKRLQTFIKKLKKMNPIITRSFTILLKFLLEL